MTGEYQKDALRMTSSTTLDEVAEFLRHRVENPISVNGTVIWDFSNHEPDMEALEFSTEHKLEKDEYVIPFQVTGSWGMFLSLLPDEFETMEILVYKKEYGDYAAYRNMYRAMVNSDEYDENEFKGVLSRAMDANEETKFDAHGP